MKKFIWIVLSIMLIMSFSACSKDKSEQSEESIVVHSEEDESENSNEEEVTSDEKLGTSYSDGQLKYNLLGSKIEEQGDYKYLIVELEVYNDGNEDIKFSAFDRLTLYGGNEEYSLDLFVSLDANLEGSITPGNKIMGEVGFDITDSSDDNYVLHIGENFEYKPAIQIGADEIGATFEQQFESSGVESEYAIGVPVESEQLNILLKSATVIPSDKEGKEVLLLDLDITNNDSESATFMLGLNFNGVYTSEGVKMDSEATEWTLQSTVESGETASGIASFYIEEGTRDFYMTVTPDLDSFSETKNIVFTAE